MWVEVRGEFIPCARYHIQGCEVATSAVAFRPISEGSQDPFSPSSPYFLTIDPPSDILLLSEKPAKGLRGCECPWAAVTIYSLVACLLVCVSNTL
ncbi:hypothetical protein EVAR_97713_1 [Eumeta japonica]|uniref:Uncharacterized protein n=1 Tax=Eumeta variegata TaxID=151549 RepID=A0A4C1XVH8_EUMVA|nr:hypothetical protein EVAR_97713_1 [Eumeta japonica]